MAPKRQPLQAESPRGGQISGTQGVPLPDSGPSSFSDATRGDHGFLPQLDADNTATIASTSPGSKIDNHSGNVLSSHIHQHVQPAGTPMSAPARNSSNPANMYGSLPGITRKITANTDNLKTDIQNLHRTLERVCNYLKLENPKPLFSINGDQQAPPVNQARSDDHANDTEGCEISPPESPSASHAPIDTFLEMAKMGKPPSSVGSPQNKKRPELLREDLISRSIISTTVAQTLLDRYFTRLDHYIYGTAGGLYDLQKLRQNSPTLLAAICTVSALHDSHDSQVYEICNRELRQLVSRSMFEKRDINHIRALCISSFWLADASRILSSDAIRRAADLRLHRLIDNASSPPQNVPQTSHHPPEVKMTDRLRLWYLLFICDQHLSILHNRDALLRGDRAVNIDWESYLSHPDTTQDDIRILSQVNLLIIMSEMRDTLGGDYETQVPQVLFSQINNYARRLDRWFNKFSLLFQPNQQIANFPRKGLELHYQFSKLYLGHHVFRNLNGQSVPSHYLTAAVAAHDAAVSIFDMILTDTTLHSSLVGMPHYFHIMIAFAGNFLLEICKNYHDQLSIRVQNDFALIEQVLGVFQTIPCISQHPIHRMTLGLGRKLYDCAASVGLPADNTRQNAYGYSTVPHQSLMSAGTGAGGVGGPMGLQHDQSEYSTMGGQPLSQMVAAQTTPDEFYLFPDLNFGFTDMTAMMGME
ncbi:hypothetical protein ZTR_01333 [Talaromyces verruculosus]|nr:hypothetical protein ZTR_01333 [Talaromyces verruculosus]